MSDYAMQAEQEIWDSVALQDYDAQRRVWIAVAAGEQNPPSAAYRRMSARFAGSCDHCKARIRRGQPIGYTSAAPAGHKVLCADCLGKLV